MEEQPECDQKRFPIIKCSCGVEFLLLPDIKEMSFVVRKHAQLHSENAKNALEAERVYSEIEDFLTSQILRKASQIG